MTERQKNRPEAKIGRVTINDREEEVSVEKEEVKPKRKKNKKKSPEVIEE